MEKEVKKQFYVELEDLVCKVCRKMTAKERADYFKFQTQRRKDKVSVPKRYKVSVWTYCRGKKKGKLREIYEIDGPLFEKLWNKINNYALISTKSSHFSDTYDDIYVQEDVLEIRYQLLWNLRNFGPDLLNTRGVKVPFYERFRRIVNNVLTNSSHIRTKRLHSRVNSDAVSLFGPVSIDCGDDGDELLLIHTLPDESLPSQSYRDLMMDLPEDLKEPVVDLINGNSVYAICKERKLKRREFENHIASILQ